MKFKQMLLKSKEKKNPRSYRNRGKKQNSRKNRQIRKYWILRRILIRKRIPERKSGSLKNRMSKKEEEGN